MQPDVIEHIGYSFTNKSNFDIRQHELKHVVDIPVFPAQNIIVDNQKVNIYDEPLSGFPSFIHSGKIYQLLSLDLSQRFLFLEYDNGSRVLDYQFGGRTYAQSRLNAAYSLTGDALYVGFGNTSNTEDMRDLWKFDLLTKTWVPEYVMGEDLSINEFMSKRRSANYTVAGSEKFIFGGKTFIEIGNTVINLNDLWWFDSIEWKLLDPLSVLPHEPGLVVWFDSTIIKILSDGKLWTVYKDVSTATTSVSYVGLTPPLNSNCITGYSGGAIYWNDFTSNKIYSWNNGTSTITVTKSDARCFGYNLGTLSYYVKSVNFATKRGGNSTYQPSIRIFTPSIYNWNDTLNKTCNLDAVPLSTYAASCDIEGGKKYIGLGLYENTFIEDHFIWDGNTNQTIRVGSDSTKPQERLMAGSCYDAKRNRIWIFGGYTGSIYYNDLWYLSLSTYQWTRVRKRMTSLVDAGGISNWPAARAQAGICVVEDSLWIVAGYSDEKSFTDMWIYDIVGDYAYQERTTDWLSFGSDYHIFAWRDRLWLFNGEYKLYRYFFEHKQFAPVTLYATRYPEIQQRINDREYITAPMHLSVQSNKLIISSIDAQTKDWFSFYVDLDSKEIIQYPGDISSASWWRDQTNGMDSSGYLYYYNVSSFDFAQRNTFPYSEYSVDPVVSENPLSRESCIMSYFDTDIIGGVARMSYIDSGNMYVIYDDQIDYQPLLPTIKELKEGLFSNYWPQMDFSVLDGTTGSAQINSKTRLGAGRFRSIPRFLWKRVPSGYSDKLRKASIAWFDESAKRTYIVNNQDGSVLRFRSEDGTFFNYPSKIWPESVTSRRGNILFAIGGNTVAGTPPGLNQNGTSGHYISTKQWKLLGADDKGGPRLACHMGMMLYDLNYITFQLKLLQTNTNITPRNYDQIRNYLVEIARGQLNVNVTGEELSEEWISIIQNSVYSDTISVVGDLSVRNIVNETGIRPFGARVSGISASVDSYMYFGGGALKWVQTVFPPCGGDEPVDVVKYSIGFPFYNQTAQRDEIVPYNDFYRFDTDTKTWFKLANLPTNIYAGSLISNKKQDKLYLIGGFTGNDLSNPSNKIYVYNILQNAWSELISLPRNYAGGGLPLVEWLDDSRMVIMFGFKGRPYSDGKSYIRSTIPDSWIIDTTSNIMYKMFESSSKTSLMLDSIEDADGFIHMIDYSRVWFSNIYDSVGADKSTKQLTINNTDIGQKDSNIIFDDDSFPMDDVGLTPNTILWTVTDPTDGSVKKTISISIPKTLSNNLDPSNIIKDFVDVRGDLWLVVNQVTQAADVDIIDSYSIYNTFFYKASKYDEWNYNLSLLPIDIPVNAGAKLIGYDGIKYLYCIWNEFNIWQLDLDIAMFNPNSTYWRRMPPYPDLAEWGLWSKATYDPSKKPEYTRSMPYRDGILFFNTKGLVVRFDPLNYMWRIDKYGSEPIYNTVVVKDGEELYYYAPGYTFGNMYGLTHLQRDKFYFDAELMEKDKDINIPVFDAIIAGMSACLSKMMENQEGFPSYNMCIAAGCSPNLAEKISTSGGSPSELWDSIKALISSRRSTVKRNRILSFNRNNHLMRAWTKKHGSLDLFFEFDSYYTADKIDISVDYDTMNDQASRYNFTCWTSAGIVSGTGSPVQTETDYDWDPFSRIYRKQVELAGPPIQTTYVESERPGYLVRFNLPPSSSLNKMRVQFEPVARESNYISRVNHIYVNHVSNSIGFTSDDGPISIVYIEPFENIESDVYVVRAINNHPTKVANNVKVYLVDNYRVLLSTTGSNWIRSNMETPITIASSLNPGQDIVFYMKAVSYLDKSNLDLVIRAEYAPE